MPTDDPQAINHAKKRLRQKMRERLRGLSKDQRLAPRPTVARNLPIGLLQAPHHAPIMTFFPTDEEPDVVPALQDLGQPLCFPSINWAHKSMEAVLVDPERFETRIQRHGIREAIGGAIVDPNDLGAIIVPGLAFDRQGHRLGRGGGFYDAFLSRIDRRFENDVPRPVVVGVCFGCQLVEKVPTFPHDQRMDVVVTEGEQIFCYAP